MSPLKFLITKHRSTIEWENFANENIVTLKINQWNDYNFETLFSMEYQSSNGEIYKLGNIKIGFIGQEETIPTRKKIGLKEFTKLDDRFFSLGTGPEYYESLMGLPHEIREQILSKLNDVVLNKKLLRNASKEKVFKFSMLRSININTIRGQFSRILNNVCESTKFDFTYNRKGHKKHSDLSLRFIVNPDSLPSTNIHTIIGRNGVGKTTLLNDMVNSIVKPSKLSKSYFHDNEEFENIGKNYFGTVISVSFSAFDPFIPSEDQNDPTKGTCFYYIGLKKLDEGKNSYTLRTDEEIRTLCAESLNVCFTDDGNKNVWLKAIKNLESDYNFEELNLSVLASLSKKERFNECIKKMKQMSSGHAIVFFTVTQLIEKTQEKTLILFDEPESHLHPPLLSALTRTLSNLLVQRNAIAILATHSPVVLQEVPKSCTWVVSRYGNEMKRSRPNIETFGENVGLLTKEVFQLEVERSGYHQLLKGSVDEYDSFDEIMTEYRDQIGFEGQALLRSLLLTRKLTNKNFDDEDI
ncbi:AAA family ATPase [Providencia sp.]|uniref:AAA family ATPase n=1 Tax=Providencia sp. TaxID=589 RepID=UPI00333EFB42